MRARALGLASPPTPRSPLRPVPRPLPAACVSAGCEPGAVAVAAEAVRVRAQLHQVNRLRASIAALNAPGRDFLGIRPSALAHRL